MPSDRYLAAGGASLSTRLFVYGVGNSGVARDSEDSPVAGEKRELVIGIVIIFLVMLLLYQVRFPAGSSPRPPTRIYRGCDVSVTLEAVVSDEKQWLYHMVHCSFLSWRSDLPPDPHVRLLEGNAERQETFRSPHHGLMRSPVNPPPA